MPITPKYTWSETDSIVFVVVSLPPGVKKQNFDVEVTELYLKINCTPALLQLDLLNGVVANLSSAVLDNLVVECTLVKKSPGKWGKLEVSGLAKSALLARRNTVPTSVPTEASQKRHSTVSATSASTHTTSLPLNNVVSSSWCFQQARSCFAQVNKNINGSHANTLKTDEKNASLILGKEENGLNVSEMETKLWLGHVYSVLSVAFSNTTTDSSVNKIVSEYVQRGASFAVLGDMNQAHINYQHALDKALLAVPSPVSSTSTTVSSTSTSPPPSPSPSPFSSTSSPDSKDTALFINALQSDLSLIKARDSEVSQALVLSSIVQAREATADLNYPRAIEYFDTALTHCSIHVKFAGSIDNNHNGFNALVNDLSCASTLQPCLHPISCNIEQPQLHHPHAPRLDWDIRVLLLNERADLHFHLQHFDRAVWDCTRALVLLSLWCDCSATQRHQPPTASTPPRPSSPSTASSSTSTNVPSPSPATPSSGAIRKTLCELGFSVSSPKEIFTPLLNKAVDLNTFCSSQLKHQLYMRLLYRRALTLICLGRFQEAIHDFQSMLRYLDCCTCNGQMILNNTHLATDSSVDNSSFITVDDDAIRDHIHFLMQNSSMPS